MTSLLDQVTYQSAIMQQLYKDLSPAIDSAASLLFWGEPGSGMGFLARAVHEASARKGKFVKISGFLLDADTVKQQFLGIDDQPGWLEEAHNGTIFLKRLSEASSEVQQTLLQLIGNQSVDGRLEFSRKGRTETIVVNIRFLYSIPQDFNMAIQDGVLRRDLVETLKKRGKILHLPALRERKEDIPVILENLFAEFNQKYHQQVAAIDKNALSVLRSYRWPGNIDELKQVMEGIFARYPNLTAITEEHLPAEIIHPQVTGDKYSFKLKEDAKFLGKFLSPRLNIKTDAKETKLAASEIQEIRRVEDTTFTPPKFKHFAVKLKDGSQIAGQILNKTLDVETPFDRCYQINPHDIYSIFLM